MKVPRISGFEAVKALSRAGYMLHYQTGSHMILIHQTRSKLSVPNHRELDTGTLRSIIEMAGLTVEEFMRLL